MSSVNSAKMSGAWASTKTKVSQSWQSTGDSHIPKSAVIILVLCLIGAFIWILVYFIKLEEGKEQGKEEDTKKKGVCSDACAEAPGTIFKTGILGPVILGFAGILVAYLITWKQRKRYAMRHITTRTYHSTKKKISKTAFLSIAFFVWIVAVAGTYIAVTFIPLKAFKKSLYKDKNAAQCKAAGKKWCKYAAPNSKIVIIVSTVGMLAILIAAFFVFRNHLTPEQAELRDNCEQISIQVQQALKQDRSIAQGVSLEQYWDNHFGTVATFEEVSGAKEACGTVLSELQSDWAMAASKAGYSQARSTAGAGGAGFFKHKGSEQAFSTLYTQKMLAKQRKMQAQKLAQAQAALQAKQARQTMASEAQSHAQAMQSLKSQMASVGQASSTTATPISPRPPPFAPQSPPDGQAVPTAPPMPPPNSPVAGQNIRY